MRQLQYQLILPTVHAYIEVFHCCVRNNTNSDLFHLRPYWYQII